MNTIFNAFDSSLQFMITFAHPAHYYGSFQKEVYAPSFNDACAVAADVKYYPIEFPDYTNMEILIHDQVTGDTTNYSELPNE